MGSFSGHRPVENPSHEYQLRTARRASRLNAPRPKRRRPRTRHGGSAPPESHTSDETPHFQCPYREEFCLVGVLLLWWLAPSGAEPLAASVSSIGPKALMRTSNGEVDGPGDHARQAPRTHTMHCVHAHGEC